MSGSTSEEVDRDFSCPICKSILKQPRITRCGHSVCHDCLAARLQSSPTVSPVPDAASPLQQEPPQPHTSYIEFTCPQEGCGRTFRLPSADIEEFPPNLYLAEIISRTASMQEKHVCTLTELESVFTIQE